MSRSMLQVYAELTRGIERRTYGGWRGGVVGRACWLKSRLAIDKLDECNLCLQPWVFVPFYTCNARMLCSCMQKSTMAQSTLAPISIPVSACASADEPDTQREK